MSSLYMPTLRDAPTDTQVSSYIFMLRSGMIRKVETGIYSYLPLGIRVIQRIEDIIREEMEKNNSQEILMPSIYTRKISKETKISDNNRDEIITKIINNELNSYKQLPLTMYEIHRNYREEKKSHFGVINSREFIEKNAYTFDMDEDGMNDSYMDMIDTYKNIFDRCNINYRLLQGDGHEFSATGDIGESSVVYCENCNYGARKNQAEVIYNLPDKSQEVALEKEEVHTPNAITVQKMEEFLKMSASNFVKTLLLDVKGEVIAVLIPADRELNQAKLARYLNVSESEIEMVDEESVKRITGAEVGFAGPLNLKEELKMLMDVRVKKMKNFIVGANKTDYHIKNVNIEDFSFEEVEDLLLIRENDTCPKCGNSLSLEKGIRLARLSKQNTKYSELLNARYLDKTGKSQNIWMGSYNLEIGRLLATIIEQNHDDKGIIWPLSVAPYQVIITVINSKKEEQRNLGEKLYNDLKDKNIEVLIDDRKERAGVKFTDAELIGIPIRITVGRDAKDSLVEFSIRGKEDKLKINKSEVFEKVKNVFREKGFKI